MEIQELAGYLPYKVFCTFKTVFEEKNYLFGKTFERVLMPLDLHYLFGSPKRYEYIKPILFPLSMLTQEITINGETFVPIEKLYDNKYATKEDLNLFYYVIKNNAAIGFEAAYYGHVQKLLSWKFDCFGLIEKGEAIAVTNDFNPYK